VPTLLHLTYCTSITSTGNLYLAKSLAAFVSEHGICSLYAMYRMSCPFPLLRSYQRISSVPKHHFVFRHCASFYFEGLLAPCPNPKLENHPLCNVRDCLFNIFPATLRIRNISFIRNLCTRQTIVTATQLSWP
jgi:hypothetical protein